MKRKIIILLGFLFLACAGRLYAGLCDTYAVYSVGAYSEAIAIGDVNSDSKNDVVVVSSFLAGETNGLCVFIQNETSQLSSPVIYPTSSFPSAVAIGDLNSDGRNDVVVANSDANNIGVYLQNNTSTLDAAVVYSVGVLPNSIKIADVDNDGKNDVVVSNGMSDYFSILLQNVGGSLDPQETHAIPSNINNKIDIADMNNDGLNDVVLMRARKAGVESVAVFLQGALDTPVYYSVSGTDTRVFGMGLGSVNSDSRVDIVASFGSGITSYIGVFTQNGVGTIDTAVNYAALDSPSTVVIGDITGDGRDDIAVLHDSQAAISFYKQSSAGTLSAYEAYVFPYSSTFSPHSMVLGDINSDSICETVIADRDNGLVIFSQYYSFSFISSQMPVQPNQISNIMQIQLLNGDASRAEAFSGTVTLSTTSPTGKFSVSSASWIDTTIVAMSAGIASFYYRDNTLGRQTVMVSRGNFISATTQILVEIPGRVIPRNNFFNPANGEKTTIYYDLPEDCAVTIKVYNLVGELVNVLVDEYKIAGSGYSVDWKGVNSNGIAVASGVYYIHINAGSFKSTMKAIVVK